MWGDCQNQILVAEATREYRRLIHKVLMTKEEIKRLFFGAEIHAPWPSSFPQGRWLDSEHRHLTLAFLGNIPYPPLRQLLESFPSTSLKLGEVGYFDSCLMLPPHHPNVIAWHAAWYHPQNRLTAFQTILSDWLLAHQYVMDARPWKAHVTLCRSPFDSNAWKKHFIPTPFYTGAIHLYESKGNLNYLPIWSYPLKSPFVEINHTADMAFKICAETLDQLYHHAFTALAFKFPELLQFFISKESLQSLDQVIISLNEIIAKMDSAVGCPLKAVSFHGEITTLQDGLLQWEMIVDV